MNRPSTHVVPLLFTALASAGVLFAVIGGSNPATLVIGLCIAVVAGVTAAVAWRRTGPIGGRIATGSWWKLVLAGPTVIAGVVVAARFGANAWMAGMFAVLAAFVLTGAGIVLGIAHLAKRRSRAIPT